MTAKEYLFAIRERGLTQVQVSARSGIPQPTISKIERGETKDVRSRNFLALQRLYLELEQTGVQEAAHG